MCQSVFSCLCVLREKSKRQAKHVLISLFSLFFPDSDGAHDGDDIGGRTGGVRPQRPADLWRVRRQGHRIPLQRHDVRGLQGILQVGVVFTLFSLLCFLEFLSLSIWRRCSQYPSYWLSCTLTVNLNTFMTVSSYVRLFYFQAGLTGIKLVR